MQLLCLYQRIDGAAVHGRVQSESTPSLDQGQWTLRFTATCTSAKTADVLLQFLEWRFAQQLEGPGLIKAPYFEVRNQLLDFVHQLESGSAAPGSPAPADWSSPRVGHALLLRVLAGIVALGVSAASIGLQVLVVFVYPIIIAARKNKSPLYTAAESAYIFTALDWTSSVQTLVRIALGQKRLWPAR